MKQCSTCGEWKPELEFRKGHKQCRSCAREYARKYYWEHKEEKNKYDRKYRQEHGEEEKKRMKKYYQEHKEGEKIRTRKYRDSHKEQYREYDRMRRKNPKLKLRHSISRSMWQSLRKGKNNYHWEHLVGYTLTNLIQHLENQFTAKMNWNNYGSYWHIDHIIPISVFNFDKYNQSDFKRCWALKNLRPLERIKNISKSNKIDKPFQPSLKI